MAIDILRAELSELERIGKISDSKDAACDPFSSREPYPLDAHLFSDAVEIADALIEGTPQGEEIIDFSKPILRTTGQQVSDCCGAYDRDMGDNDSSFSDFGFCPECRDHCTFIDEEEDV